MARHFTPVGGKKMKHTEFTTFMLLDIAPCVCVTTFDIKMNLEMKFPFRLCDPRQHSESLSLSR